MSFKKYIGLLGSASGPVIQANGRLIFEDDLRSGGLLCFISMNTSVHTELTDSLVTLHSDPNGPKVSKKSEMVICYSNIHFFCIPVDF